MRKGLASAAAPLTEPLLPMRCALAALFAMASPGCRCRAHAFEVAVKQSPHGHSLDQKPPTRPAIENSRCTKSPLVDYKISYTDRIVQNYDWDILLLGDNLQSDSTPAGWIASTAK